jgi:hypothetical protein
MNYEDFSPEAKAGIEQFRKLIINLSKDKIKNDNGLLWISDNGRSLHTSIYDFVILYRVSRKESAKVADFAQAKNFWLD